MESYCIVGVTKKQTPHVWGPFATYEAAIAAMAKLTGQEGEKVVDGNTVYHLSTIYQTVA